METAEKNKGWIVTFAGTGINLALGILYTWSIFKVAIENSIKTGGPGAFDWNLASLNDPYAICCLVFAGAMIVAGKLQDKVGPQKTAMIGGVLVGLGFVLISQTTDYVAWLVGFGVLAGTGIGFGYASATPPALKWFPPARTGLIAGLVVSGFGLASVYIAPLSKYLVTSWGLQKAMLIFGLAFVVVVCGLSLLLTNPPKGYKPATKTKPGEADSPKVLIYHDANPRDILKTVVFYVLWTAFAFGAGAGLMVIGSVASLAQKSLGEMAFLAVALMAVGNAGGRIVAGMLSDKIGRKRALSLIHAIQCGLMIWAIPVTASSNAFQLVVLAMLIGFCYGANLSIFPSFAKDYWGLKNFGMNYGMLFTAWGIGGLVFPRLSQTWAATTGGFKLSFIIAGVLLMVGALLAMALPDPPKPRVVHWATPISPEVSEENGETAAAAEPNPSRS